MGRKPVRGRRKRQEKEKKQKERKSVGGRGMKYKDRIEMKCLGHLSAFISKKARYKLGHTQLSLCNLCSRDFQLLERLLTIQHTSYYDLMYCLGGAHPYSNHSKFSFSHALSTALMQLTQIMFIYIYCLLSFIPEGYATTFWNKYLKSS